MGFKIASFFIFLISAFILAEEPSIESKPGFQQRFEALQTNLNSDPKVRFQEVNNLWIDISSELIANIQNPKIYSNSEGYDKSDLENWQTLVSRKFTLLKKTSRLRAKILKEPDTEKFIQWNESTIKTMVLELAIIPYKFAAYAYDKSYWLYDKVNKGIFGIGQLALEIFLLIVMLLVPLAFFKASKKVDQLIDQQKRKSFYYSFKSKWHRNLIPFLSIISVYVPWIFYFLALGFLERLLSLSEFSEFSVILPYGYFYIYYKIFRATLEIGLHELSLRIPPNARGDINKKVTNTSRLLGLFLLFVYSIKTLLYSVLGESLIFLIIEPFFGYIVLGILFYVSAKWEKEIEAYLRDTNIKIFQLYSKEMEKRYSLFLSLPGLILISAHFCVDFIIEWSSRFDLVKVIYAKVLRVKFETTRSKSDEMGEVSQEYISIFRDKSKDYFNDKIFETHFFKSIDSQMDSWSEGKTQEQTVACYGPKGCGKTVFLGMLEKRVSEKGLRCLRLSVPPKIFTEKGFVTFFDEVFNLSKEDKTVVLLDNVHNLFLSTIGGFEIYKKFLQKIEESDHVFWVGTFNEYSWMFLNSVLGKNQYFRLEMKMPKWPIEQIMTLVHGVHSMTGFSLFYDEIFKSSQKYQDGVTTAESRYFYLLWERCSGNPGTAIRYWFKSLHNYGSQRLMASLPRENPVSELNGLHQEMHFVYASLVKHENLNISEATRATNLPRPVVKQAVYRGVEEGFLDVEKGRYSINLDWNDDLKKYLKGKNLVYEING